MLELIVNSTLFSRIISRVFLGNWLLILIVVGLFRTGPTKAPVEILLPLFFILISLISVAFNILKRKGKISDWDITKREERHIYFSVICGVTLLGTIFSYFLVNFEYFVLNLVLFILAITLILFTFVFKISAHLILNVGSVFLLNYLFDWKLLWLFAIVPAVAFARIYLRKHTLFQVLSGAAVGFFVPYLTLKIFKLI